MLLVAVCDDDPAQVQYLTALASCWANQREITLCVQPYTTAEAFYFDWSSGVVFDILLLDIQMPGMDGVALARRLRQSGGQLVIIFITAFNDCMDQGYEVDALHYLLKPVNEKKLFATLNRALESLDRQRRTVVLEIDGALEQIPIDEILYLEALSHTVMLYTIRKSYALRQPMRQLEVDLGEGFFRCHRSYLVALRYIRRITRDTVLLENGQSLPLSRKRYEAANHALMGYFRECSI